MSASLGHAITLSTADGVQLPAWAALPEGPARGAVVVVQEIFGVNSHIRAITERFAAQGYAAVAPALFHRLEPAAAAASASGMGVELGYAAADVDTGRTLKGRAEGLEGSPSVRQDIRAAADWLVAQTGQKVGVIGFCWGGLLAWRAACALPQISAAISYYGGGITTPAERARQALCPVMAQFGKRDALIPLDGVQAFAEAQPQVQVHLYDADHGFNCDQRGSYDEAAATAARARSLAFFAEHLR